MVTPRKNRDAEGREPLPTNAPRGLTGKQRRFIEEYMVHRNACRAARVAGYSSPEQMGPQLLTMKLYPDVATEVQRREKEIAEKLAVSAERVVRELAAVGFFNPRDLLREDGTLMDLAEMPDHLALAIQSMDVTEVPVLVPGGKRKGKGRRGSGDGDGAQVVSGRRVEIKFYNKLESLNMLAKHLGLFKDVTVQNTVNVGVNWDALLGPPNRPNAVNERVERLLESAERGAEGSNGSARNAPVGHTENLPRREDVAGEEEGSDA